MQFGQTTSALYPLGGSLTPPGRLPGFDSQHPIAKGIVPGHGFSGVATGNAGFVNLLTGAPGVKTGTQVAKIDAYIGQNFAVNGSGTSHFDWPGQLGEAEKFGTFGSMIINTGAGAFFFNTSSTNAGIAQGFLTAGSVFNFNVNGLVSIASTISFTVGVPYFFACSSFARGAGIPAPTNFVARNMITGIIQAQTIGGTNWIAANIGNGTYRLGDRAGSTPLTGNVAAMMYAPFFATMPDLYKWARDPWSFWYPPGIENIVFNSIRQPIPPPPPVLGLLGLAACEY